MKLIVTAVRDRAIDAFQRPMFTPSAGLIVRSFTDEVNRAGEDNPMYKHPEDFDLYSLGTFDEDTGRFENHQQPERLCRGQDVKR